MEQGEGEGSGAAACTPLPPRRVPVPVRLTHSPRLTVPVTPPRGWCCLSSARRVTCHGQLVEPDSDFRVGAMAHSACRHKKDATTWTRTMTPAGGRGRALPLSYRGYPEGFPRGGAK
eukprot:973521-Rhodomonas_salina.1